MSLRCFLEISDQQSPIFVSLFGEILPLLIIRLSILTKPGTLAMWLLPLWKINDFQSHHCHWMNGLESTHWYQWNGNGFLVWQPLVPMEWRWFSMVCNHWSNNGMVTIHRFGLLEFLKYSAFCKMSEPELNFVSVILRGHFLTLHYGSGSM